MGRLVNQLSEVIVEEGGSIFFLGSTDWTRKATVIGGSMFSVSDPQFGRII